MPEERIDFLLLEMDSSGVIHNALSLPRTLPVPITVREMDVQLLDQGTHTAQDEQGPGSVPTQHHAARSVPLGPIQVAMGVPAGQRAG